MRNNNTVLSIKFFKSKNFISSNIGIFLTGIASNGPIILLPLFFQNTKGFPVIKAGLMLISQGLRIFVTQPLIGKMIVPDI